MHEESKDSITIMIFESLIASRKSLPNADEWLAGLRDSYQLMMPHLNVSEAVKNYIKEKIDDSIAEKT